MGAAASAARAGATGAPAANAAAATRAVIKILRIASPLRPMPLISCGGVDRRNHRRSFDVAKPEFVGEAVIFGQRTQFVPGRLLDLDAVGAAVEFAHVFDLTGIEDPRATLGGRR